MTWRGHTHDTTPNALVLQPLSYWIYFRNTENKRPWIWQLCRHLLHVSCHYDNLRSSQRRQSCQCDDLLFSVESTRIYFLKSCPRLDNIWLISMIYSPCDIKVQPRGCWIFSMIGLLHEAPSTEITTTMGAGFLAGTEWSIEKICSNKCGFIFIPHLSIFVKVHRHRPNLIIHCINCMNGTGLAPKLCRSCAGESCNEMASG